jgi:hypothetical protein
MTVEAAGRKPSRLLFTRQIAVEIAKNVAMGSAIVRSLRLRKPRTTVSAANPANDVMERYALALPKKLLATLGSVKELDVAEIGPGDHIATGLGILAAGARSYTCLDRFPGEYGNAYAKGFYSGVRSVWPAAFPALQWPDWLDPKKFPEAYPERVRAIRFGVESAAAAEVLPQCDLVCSYAVGEHVLDVRAFAQASFDLLRPGGVAVHVVDFSQHFDWSRYGDIYLYLSLSDRLWSWMGSNRGLPNRVRYHEFLEHLQAVGFVVETHNRRLADEAPTTEYLLPRFRSMPMDSLRTLDATFVCRRPV